MEGLPTMQSKDTTLEQIFTVTIRANAESIIANARFTGQSRNFTLERFLSQLQGAWNDLPEEEVSEERKLSVLMRALQAPELAATKQTILATPGLRGDYDAAVNLLTENHIRIRENARGAQRGVGATDTTGNRGGQARDARRMRGGGRPQGGRHGGRGGGRFGGRGGRGRGNSRGRGRGAGRTYNPRSPGRYYSHEEWARLTDEQRAQVRAARDQQQRNNNQVAAYAAQVGIAAYAQGQAAAGGQADNDARPNVQFQIAGTHQQPSQQVVLPPPPANLVPPTGVGIGATMSRRNYGRPNRN